MVYAYAPSSLPFPIEDAEIIIVAYQANEIGKPLQYWVLTDPDPAILEAIAKSSTAEIYDPELDITWEHWTHARANETTFIYQVYEHGGIWEIEYQGHYYRVECLYMRERPAWAGFPNIHVIYNPRHQKETATAIGAILSGGWIALGSVWIKKRQ